MQKWQTIQSKTIFTHPRLTLAEDEVELPNGKTAQYLKFIDVRDAVTVVAQRSDGKLLLQTEYSYPPDEILYQFPGGGVELGEELDVAAQRELAEEAQLQAARWHYLGGYYTNNRRSSAKMHVFLAADLTEIVATGDPEEFIESEWKTPAEIEQMIAQGRILNFSVLAAWPLLKLRADG